MLLIHRYNTPILTGPSLHFTALQHHFTSPTLNTLFHGTPRFKPLHCIGETAHNSARLYYSNVHDVSKSHWTFDVKRFASAVKWILRIPVYAISPTELVFPQSHYVSLSTCTKLILHPRALYSNLFSKLGHWYHASNNVAIRVSMVTNKSYLIFRVLSSVSGVLGTLLDLL
jgi:hypothetical protein